MDKIGKISSKIVILENLHFCQSRDEKKEFLNGISFAVSLLNAGVESSTLLESVEEIAKSMGFISTDLNLISEDTLKQITQISKDNGSNR